MASDAWRGWRRVEPLGARDHERLREVAESLTEDSGQTDYSSLLKPCPFCGGQAWIQTYDMGWGCEARVVCGQCHVATSRDYAPGRVTYLPTGEDVTRLLVIDSAIKTWNRRA